MFDRKHILTYLLVFSVSLLVGSSAEARPKPMEIGKKAPSFTLKGVDGKKHSLSDYSDAKVLAIIFTCNHCPTAQAYEERIKKMVKDYSEKSVSFVAISPNDPKALRPDELRYSDLNDGYEEMKIRAKEHNFNFPYLYDGDDQKVSKKYGPVATPHVFIFDSDRRLRYEGGIDDNENPSKRTKTYARNVIDALLNGKKVPRKNSKVFGCSVKWSYKRKQVKQAKKKYKHEPVKLKKTDVKEIKKFVGGKSKKIRMINVWATWCGPCKKEFPELVNIHRIYRSRNFELRTVSLDPMNKKENALDFLRKQNASMKNYILPSTAREEFAGVLDPKWRGPLPHTVIIDTKGNMIYRKNGRFDPHEVKKVIVERLGRTYYE